MNRRQYQKRRNILQVLALLLLVAAMNAAASFMPLRWDLTAEKRYTLSGATRHLLGQLDAPVRIKVFLKGKYPAGFRHLAVSTRDLLDEFQRYAGGRVRYEFVNPLEGVPDSLKATVQDSLAAMGILPYNIRARENSAAGMSVQLAFPAALVDYHGHQLAVQLLPAQPGADPLRSLNQAGAQLEYRFAQALYRLQRDAPPLAGYLLGNGEPIGPEVFDLLTMLQQNSRLDTLNLAAAPAVPPGFDLLVVTRPQRAFTEDEKLKLDQYIMQGGKVLWLLDPVAASMDSLQRRSSFVAFDRGLNLEDMLFTYGVRINPDLIRDLQCFSIPLTVGSQGGRPQIERLPWPYFPLLDGTADHPIVKNLDLVLARFASSIDTIRNNAVRKTVLLASSDHSLRAGTPREVSFEELKTAPDPRSFGASHLPVAVLLEGRFPSVFRNRLDADMRNRIDSVFPYPYRDRSVPGKMIVVSDADIALNEVSPQDGPLAMGTDLYTRQQFGNREFLQNCLSYLADTSAILEARSKDFRLRLLDPERVRTAGSRWQLINFVVPLLFVLLCGAGFRYLRQRRYSS
ncbi:gliding motility-associated ABC transporter substrate-binding protein GldG [Compostibacter hankyongensis]|uniref:Gliding motility-associated ABC transporter substrate-binding protein GldG n=1 Tax=Compostibacter hankyongensis TaxID=1007089 RepID=A0ABP8FU14_9BACT